MLRLASGDTLTHLAAASGYFVQTDPQNERETFARLLADPQVLSVEPLHSNATSVALAPRAAGQPTLHTHDQGDLPFPTDVALVLRHRALAPHLVLTPRFMFRIDSEGVVTWLGPNTLPPPSRTGDAP